MTVSSIQPGVRIRVLPRFPSQAVGGTGLVLTKANGIWTFALDFAELVEQATVSAPTTSFLALYNSASQSFSRISVTNFNSAVVASFYSGLVIAEKTSAGDYTMLSADDIILINKSSGAATTVNLVTAVGRTRPVKIVDLKGDADTNNITIDGSGAETIVGLSTYVLSFPRASVTLWPIPSGAGWYI